MRRTRNFSIVISITILFALEGLSSAVMAQTTPSDKETVDSEIAKALSAAPPNIANDAAVAVVENGKMKIIREGTNGFTCMPANPKWVNQTMCMDEASMQWSNDLVQHKPKPSNTTPGITYMLAGGTQRSDTDPYDKTSPVINVGPHWMIIWPFDPKTTGLPVGHKASGSYIKWAGSPYAYLVVTGKP